MRAGLQLLLLQHPFSPSTKPATTISLPPSPPSLGVPHPLRHRKRKSRCWQQLLALTPPPPHPSKHTNKLLFWQLRLCSRCIYSIIHPQSVQAVLGWEGQNILVIRKVKMNVNTLSTPVSKHAKAALGMQRARRDSRGCWVCCSGSLTVFCLLQGRAGQLSLKIIRSWCANSFAQPEVPVCSRLARA